ncbi:hypothetical protein C0J52_03960 [Blattella germanica]|nr:hypothetical protein C0J52_03960 [Blattella germanica]
MATEGCWNNLPSVILLEIYSYLPQEDKIRASSTCKHWRYALYHPSFWQSIHFKAKTKDQNSTSRTRYLTDCFAKKLRNATVSFDSMDPLCVQEAARVLQKLCENDHLQRLILIPSHCRFECPGRIDEQKQFFKTHILKPMRLLMEQSHRLEALSLGCSEELTVYVSAFLDLLTEHQSCSLRRLGLASVKDDPDDYLLLDLEPNRFRSLQMLQVLSVDYDYVNDNMLAALCDVRLVRFIIHVHGIVENHPGTTNSAWTNFSQHNPSCELRLTLIHSYEAVEILHSDILKPSMPLTHLKAFFCEQLNSAALHRLSTWYAKCLRSLWWVDSLGSAASQSLVQPMGEEPDPIVMAAWRCTQLEEIVLLAQDILYDLEDDTVDAEEDLQFEITEALGAIWTPLLDSQLHDVILNPTGGDSDEFILPVVLRDEDV